MANTISNSDDVIDSRDIIARVKELESERQDILTRIEELNSFEATHHESVADLLQEAKKGLEVWDADYGDELKALQALVNEAEGCGDWAYGATLIRDSYFKEYAQEFAEDIGAVQPGASWPNNCIDWDQAASQLQWDFTSVDFDGTTYWIR